MTLNEVLTQYLIILNWLQSRHPKDNLRTWRVHTTCSRKRWIWNPIRRVASNIWIDGQWFENVGLEKAEILTLQDQQWIHLPRWSSCSVLQRKAAVQFCWRHSNLNVVWSKCSLFPYWNCHIDSQTGAKSDSRNLRKYTGIGSPKSAHCSGLANSHLGW